MNAICRICGTAGRACGNSHVSLPVVDLPPRKGDNAMSQPQELKEYTYHVGHVPTTAMLTEAQAQRLGATPVDEDEDTPQEGDSQPNREADRMQTHNRKADDAGVNATYADGTTGADAAEKARTARNKRAG